MQADLPVVALVLQKHQHGTITPLMFHPAGHFEIAGFFKTGRSNVLYQCYFATISALCRQTCQGAHSCCVLRQAEAWLLSAMQLGNYSWQIPELVTTLTLLHRALLV